MRARVCVRVYLWVCYFVYARARVCVCECVCVVYLHEITRLVPPRVHIEILYPQVGSYCVFHAVKIMIKTIIKHASKYLAKVEVVALFVSRGRRECVLYQCCRLFC